MTGNEASPIVPSSGERIVVTDKGISQIVASNWKRVKFVEAKPLDMALVTELLDECAAVNQWANFGPLYSRLVEEYAAHMSLGPDLALTPCANAGIALEMVARTLAADAGKPQLRWIGSAFSFKNLGRGYFTDMQILDCDDQGLLDLAALEAVPSDDYDGFIVTNPFGMASDFDRFIRFAEATGKKLVIDNAAGLDRSIPPWPWQVFSLHHTKPYGFGEGGLVLSPATAKDFLRLLINYDRIPDAPAYWLNNGKISDVACAFLIARLRTSGTWEQSYLEQRERINALFVVAGAVSLLPVEGAPPSNSLPVLFGQEIDEDKLGQAVLNVDIARQYPPLAPLPRVSGIYRQLINYPVHPDLNGLSDTQISQDIEMLLGSRTGNEKF